MELLLDKTRTWGIIGHKLTQTLQIVVDRCRLEKHHHKQLVFVQLLFLTIQSM